MRLNIVEKIRHERSHFLNRVRLGSMKFVSLKKFFSFFTSEITLFSLIFSLMFINFRGLILHYGKLPGIDNPPHYFTLSKMATEYLPKGHITGYLLEWFGGMPLFQFYPPLFFILISVVWLLIGKAVPLFLLYRFAIFIIIFSTSICFWYFLKSFFDRKVARWGILLSTIFIFYPKWASLYSMGAGAAIYVGLISSILGLNLLLLWLGLLERLRRGPTLIIFILNIIVLTSLVLTHILNTVGGFFLVFLYLLYNIRDVDFLKRAIKSIGLSLLLSSFWLGPFIKYSSLTSGISVRTLNLDPLLILFPFNPSLLLSFHTITLFKFWAFALLVLTILGLYHLIFKEKKYGMPLLFISTFTLLTRSYFPVLFPNIPLHYYRFLPILFFLALTISAYELNRLWLFFHQRNKSYLLIGLLLLLLTQTQLYLDQSVSDFHPRFLKLYKKEWISNWQFQDYPYAREGQILLGKLRSLDIQRVLVQMPFREGRDLVGSPHFFSSEIPFDNKQAVIGGLYTESSVLTPFIMPTLHTLTDNQIHLWSDNRLLGISSFRAQDTKVHLKRLRMFGVNYIVGYSQGFISKIAQNKDLELVDSTEQFKIYKLLKSYPLVYPSKYKPAVYINVDNYVSFQDLALALFADTDTFEFPVVEGHFNINKLNKKLLRPFSIIIISGSNLSVSQLLKLRTLDHPIIIINPDEKLNERFANLKDIHFIEDFELVPRTFNINYGDIPDGWTDLQTKVKSYMKLYQISDSLTVKVEKFTDSQIIMEGSGPIILNIGYSPYWQEVNCKECHIFRVTPSQILIFSNGRATLEYLPDTTKRISEAISVITLLSITFYVLLRIFSYTKNRFLWST